MEKSKNAYGTVSEGSVGPFNEDSASFRHSREDAGPLQEDNTRLRKVERVPPTRTATLEGAMDVLAVNRQQGSVGASCPGAQRSDCPCCDPGVRASSAS